MRLVDSDEQSLSAHVEAALERPWALWSQPFSIGTLTMLPHSVHEPS